MPRLALALAAGGLALGVAAEWSSLLPESPGLAAGDFFVGLAFIGLGALTLRRSPATGALMAATGFAWFLGGLVGALVFLHRGPLVHLLLSYPSGRLETRLERLVVAGAYACAAVYPLGKSNVATLILVAVVVAIAAVRYARSGGAERLARACALAAAIGTGVVLAAAAAVRLRGADADSALLWAYEVALALAACGLYAGLRWGRWTQAAVTGLVVELGDLGREATLGARLARSVGDPSLELGYWDRSSKAYLGEAGRRIDLEPPPGRALLAVADERGEPAAAILHDSDVLADGRLAEAVSAAVRIALANVELQAQVEAKVEELQASRRRLVEAAVDESRRLERELHAAAQPRLQRVAQLLEDGGPSFHALREELDAVGAELGELARGIHPSSLTESGLGAALEELASRFPFAVELDVEDDFQPAPTVAAAAYFVCSEGLANAAKHAHTDGVRLSARQLDRRVLVEVCDDGIGGADLGRGSGLRGIVDRVEALGGDLALQSPAGAGTRLAATIPASGIPTRLPLTVGSVG